MYIKSLGKALNVLETVVQAPDGLTAQMISSALDMPYATAFRILYTLREEGYLTLNEAQKVYRAGPALLRLYAPVTQQMNLGRVVYPFLSQLASQTRETVHLGIRQATDVVYLDTILAPESFTMYTPVGTRTWLHATALGKALLAFSPDSEIERILRDYKFTPLTSNTIRSKDQMWDEIHRIRSRGFATEKQEGSPDSRCVASVILNQAGLPEGAISVSTRGDRLVDPQMVESFGQWTCQACRSASLELGARIGHDPAMWYQEIRRTL